MIRSSIMSLLPLHEFVYQVSAASRHAGALREVSVFGNCILKLKYSAYLKITMEVALEMGLLNIGAARET
jgi:hypothetical protein